MYLNSIKFTKIGEMMMVIIKTQIFAINLIIVFLYIIQEIFEIIVIYFFCFY